MKNIILGAGVTGLTAAAHLKDCCVLEKDGAVGGLARTVYFDEFKFDYGGHRFFSGDAELNRYFHQLLHGELVTVNRTSKIYRNGRHVDYPISVSLLFQENLLRLAYQYLTYIFRKVYAKTPEVSFEDYIVNNLGDAIYRDYFRDYTKKVWGVDCNALSSDFARQRIRGVSVTSALKNIFCKRSTVKSYADQFDYPRNGIGRLCEILARGTDVRLGANVTALRTKGERIEAVALATGESLACDTVISTIPINALCQMLNPPAEVAEAASRLRYRDLIVVFIAYAKEHLTDWHWIYFPGKEIFGRVHEPKNWSASMAPAGKTGICMEIFCDEGDPAWQMDDALLVKKCAADLYLHDPDRMLAAKVIRVKHAYPVYLRDYRENLNIVEEYLSRYGNLFIAGRTGGFKYLNMDECMREGMTVARQVAQRI